MLYTAHDCIPSTCALLQQPTHQSLNTHFLVENRAPALNTVLFVHLSATVTDSMCSLVTPCRRQMLSASVWTRLPRSCPLARPQAQSSVSTAVQQPCNWCNVLQASCVCCPALSAVIAKHRRDMTVVSRLSPAMRPLSNAESHAHERPWLGSWKSWHAHPPCFGP
jgi:hypothetical protein